MLTRNSPLATGLILAGLGALALGLTLAPAPAGAPRTGAAVQAAPAATATATQACGPSGWSPGAALPYAAQDLALAGDGTGFWAGGGWDGTVRHADWLRYDPGADTWTPRAPAPAGWSAAAAVAGDTGKIYVLGGVGPDGAPTTTLRIYDSMADTWTTGAALPGARAALAAGYANGTIVVAGGTDGTAAQATTWAYAVAADTWTALSPLPAPVAGAAFALVGGRLYLAGGDDGRTALVAYDLVDGAWHTLAPLPQGRAGAAAAAVDGKLWVAGGANGGPLAGTVIYDPLSNTWRTGRPLNTARTHLALAAAGELVAAIGGMDTAAQATNEVAAGELPCIPTAVPTESQPLATPTPTGAPPPPPAAGPVAKGPGNQDAAQMDGHVVVWETDASGTWDIAAKDLATNQTPTVYAGPGDQRLPAISGALVVWQDNRNGDWDIYGARLSGDTAGPAFAIATGPGDQLHPAVSGNVVTWEDHQGVRVAIVAEDVTVGYPRTLSEAGTTNLNPALDGSLVVWQSTVPTTTQRLPLTAGEWQIVGLDLSAGPVFAITQGAGQHTNPAIGGTLVVWQEWHPGGHWTIAGIDLATHRPLTFPAPPGDQTAPAISDGTVVYVQEDPGGPGDALLDCAGPLGHGHRTVRQVDARHPAPDPGTVSADACFVDHPRVSRSRVTWEQQAPSADLDVYGNLCTTGFTDVQPADYFYGPVQALSCAGAISGYGDNTFRPYANTTRGQLAKIIVLGEGWSLDTTGGPHFADVPASNPFYEVVETAYNRHVISGYADGTFQWGANVTRAQLAKIVVGAQGWALDTTGGPHFADVPASNPFYAYVETAYHRGIISGYGDGTFRWGANATRAQIAKIVWGALNPP